jgi:hypothetical protein
LGFLANVLFVSVGKMKTISDDEFASYLVRAKQKMEAPDASVDPISQVVVASKAGGKGVKRGRKTEDASPSNKAARLSDDVEIVDYDEGDKVQEQRPPPLVKGGRTTRRRAATNVNPPVSQSDAIDSAAAEGESSRREPLPTWNEDFNPITFVAENLKGCTSRLDALSLEELRKLSVRTGLKCLALNQMVFTHQEREAAEKLEKEVGAAKENLEKNLADQLAKSQAGFNKSLAKEKKRISALRKDKRNLVTARNAMIVALVKIWKDAFKRDDDMSKLQAAADRLDGDLKELEDENDELKENMASKYVAGFQAAIEQVRVLFPDIDGDVLAQADFLKKIDDGKLVPRLPA